MRLTVQPLTDWSIPAYVLIIFEDRLISSHYTACALFCKNVISVQLHSKRNDLGREEQTHSTKLSGDFDFSEKGIVEYSSLGVSSGIRCLKSTFWAQSASPKLMNATMCFFSSTSVSYSRQGVPEEHRHYPDRQICTNFRWHFQFRCINFAKCPPHGT